jgi:long-chain acyl-CoA synthetase
MTRLREWAEKQPEKMAFVFPELDKSMTFRELDEQADRAARWLVSLGLQAGDAIALLLENRPELLVLGFAARRAGLYFTPMSTHLKPPEIAHILKDCSARVLVTSAKMAGLAQDILQTGAAGEVRRFMLDAPASGYDSCEAAIAAVQADGPLSPRPVGRDFLYSSGTTGLPKGIRKALTPYEDRFKEDREVTVWQQAYGIGPDTVYLSPAPLYHAAPLRFTMRTIESGGSCVILVKFDAAAALGLIARYRVTHSQWVPTMFSRMLDLPEEERARHDVSSMRVAVHAAAPCPVHVKEKMIAWWGPVLTEYYAGSEGIGMTVIHSQEWLTHKGSVGRPALGTIHIVAESEESDSEEIVELPPGEVGQVYFSGGPRFEYHNDPVKTRSAYNAAGWATYGDLGHVDEEGYLYLSDRRSDLILSGGVNIYPQEIENCLVLHPAVADAAVIGVPHRDFGEEVKAVVQLRDPAQAGPALAEELTAFCRERLSGIKTPRSIDFTTTLPRQENGKLLRRRLKEQYRQRAGA